MFERPFDSRPQYIQTCTYILCVHVYFHISHDICSTLYYLVFSERHIRFEERESGREREKNPKRRRRIKHASSTICMLWGPTVLFPAKLSLSQKAAAAAARVIKAATTTTTTKRRTLRLCCCGCCWLCAACVGKKGSHFSL